MKSDLEPLITIPEPNQARSREALERILVTGERLLATNQYEETGIADISKMASSSVGTFYRVLGDKDTLSLLLLQRFMFTLEADLKRELAPDKWRGRGINDIAKRAVELFVEKYRGRRGVLRALILRASQDVDFRDRVHALNDSIAGTVAKLLYARLADISHPKPKVAIKAVTHIVLGALNQHTVTGVLGGIRQKDLVDELSRVFISYLGVKD